MATRRERLIVYTCIFIAIIFFSSASFQCNAAELWAGANWDHVSQVDVGPPFNDKNESSVDHMGIHIELHTFITDQSHWVLGISMGENSNWTGASIPWDDGGGVGSRVYVEYNYKLLTF